MTVAAGYSKRRHADELPLRPATVAHLRQRLNNELPTDAVFNLPSQYNMVDMLRADLADARSSWLDEAPTPKLAQTLARHSDINLTMSRYTHTTKGEQSDALATLPDLTSAEPQAQRATGTDVITVGRLEAVAQAPNVLASCLAQYDSDRLHSVRLVAVKGEGKREGENRQNPHETGPKPGKNPGENK